MCPFSLKTSENTWVYKDKNQLYELNKIKIKFKFKLNKMNQPFSSQCSLLTPLKTSENLWFSDVFRGIKREHWEGKG